MAQYTYNMKQSTRVQQILATHFCFIVQLYSHYIAFFNVLNCFLINCFETFYNFNFIYKKQNENKQKTKTLKA